ncbi:MAG: prolyl oligopeptidase family serine peptidase [Deltaproteobacteria bacterium]
MTQLPQVTSTERVRGPRDFVAPVGDAFTQRPLDAEDPRWRTFRVVYPAHRPDREENKNYAATVRVPVGMPRGLIVVLPILGGDYGPSEAFATHLAGAGFTTMRFDRKAEIFDASKDFRHVAMMMTQGVIDVRRGLAWARRSRLAGRGRIGVLGISMGSFVGTLVAATDPGVDAAALALGGAGLPKILFAAQSEKEIGALFAGLRDRGYDDERIRAEMVRDLSSVDPIHYAKALDPTRTLLVHARLDGVVPFENGQQIYEAMGRPRRLVTMTGHYTAALLLPVILAEVEAHFSRQLDPVPTWRAP